MIKKLSVVLFALLLSSLWLCGPALAQTNSDDALATGMGLVTLICVGVVLLVSLAFFVFWIVMLVDCFQRDNSEFPNATENTKTVWVVILLVSWLFSLYWLAAIIYYFMVKRKMPRQAKG